MRESVSPPPRSPKPGPPECVAPRLLGVSAGAYPGGVTPADFTVATASDDGVRPLLKGWSHVAAAVAATAICPILIALAPPGTRASAAIYAACVIGLFTISATYHRVRWQRPAAYFLMRRLDHSMIFVVIAATYTPIAVVALPEAQGRMILSVVWAGAIGGALLQLFWPGAPRKLVVGLYLVVGWVALLVIVDIWRELGVAGFVLLMVGGLLHSIGAFVYATRRPDPWPRVFGFHEVFHLFVIGGIAAHYVVIAFFALR